MGVFILIMFIPVIIGIIIGVSNSSNKKSDYKNACEQAELYLSEIGFKIDKSQGSTQGKLYVDNTKKMWAIKEYDGNPNIKAYRYDELIDFELIEDDESVMKGGFGKAVAGGILGGTKGAVIGSAGSRKIKQNVNLLQVIVRTNDLEHPQYVLPFIQGFSCPKNSELYRMQYNNAQQVISLLNFISTNGEENKKAEINISSIKQVSESDELIKFKQLLDDGIITQEEFDAKKRQILGL